MLRLPLNRRESESPDLPPQQPDSGVAPDQIVAPGTPPPLNHNLPTISVRQAKPGRGRRHKSKAVEQRGYVVGATRPQGNVQDVALAATLRASALRRAKYSHNSPDIDLPNQPLITANDLRVKIRHARTGNLILFVVDASGSMGARKRMVTVKGAILSLLLDAYQKRDRVGLITFRGQGAKVLVSPTNSVELAERQLRQLPTGGRTPLTAGLQLADQMLGNYLRKDAALIPLLVLVTDGRANSRQANHLRQTALMLQQKQIAALVLDSEQGFVKLGKARQIAEWLGGDYLPLEGLQSNQVSRQVRQRLRKKSGG